MSRTIKLYCWVSDDAPDHIEEIDFPLSSTVAALKKEITDRRLVPLSTGESRKLSLWTVPMAEEMISRLETLKVEWRDLPNIQQLWPPSKLSEIFTSPLEKAHVHIVIVQCPSK